MATVASRGSGTPTTSGTTWAATTNAVDGAVGTNPATYATWTNATSGATGYIEISGHNFAATIGASDTINSVTVSIRTLVNNTGRVTAVSYRPYDGGTPLDSVAGGTIATTAHNNTATFNTVTATQLRSATFRIRITFTHGGNTQSGIGSVDYADVTVDYTPAPPSITQAAYQFFDDAGTESGATALAALNTAVTGDVTNGDGYGQIRVRLQSTTAIAVPATDDFRLQYEKNASGTWLDVTSTGVESLLRDYDETNQSSTEALRGTTNRMYQTFLGDGRLLTKTAWYLGKSGAPTGALTAELHAHTGTFGTSGSPGTFLVDATTLLDAASLSTSQAWIEFIFPPYQLTNGTAYCTIISFTGGDASNYVTSGQDGTTPTDPGNMGIWNTSFWSASSWDAVYRVYTSTVANTVVPYDSPTLTESAATTNRLTGGTGTFTAGKVSEVGNVTNIGWAGNNYTELLYSVRLIAADLDNGDTLRFRVIRNGSTAGMTYTQTPTINITETVIPPQTWTGGSTGTAGAAGISGSFIGGPPPQTWAGSIATLGVLAVSGDFPLAPIVGGRNLETGSPRISESGVLKRLETQEVPLNIGWRAAFWAEGSRLQALGVADGGAIPEWSDEMGTAVAFTQSDPAKRPLYRASVARLNNQPAIDPDGIDDTLVGTPAYLAHPFSIVIICAPQGTWANLAYISQIWPGLMIQIPGGNQVWNAQQGAATLNGGSYSGNYNARLFLVYFNLTNSAMQMDDDPSTIVTGSLESTGPQHGLEAATTWLFSYNGDQRFVADPVAFLALYEGDVRADSRWPEFVEWAQDHYGVPQPPEVWEGSIGTSGVAGISGDFTSTVIWAGSTATVESAGITGTFTPGETAWTGGSTATSGAAGISGAFASVVTWAGSTATVGAAGITGAFVAGTITWTGSTATAGVTAVSDLMVGGATTWAGSTATTGVAGVSDAFVLAAGPAQIWGGAAAPTLEVTTGLTVWMDASTLTPGALAAWSNQGSGPDPVIQGTPIPNVGETLLNGMPVVRFRPSQGSIRGTGLCTDGGFDVSVIYLARWCGPNLGRMFTNMYPPFNYLVGAHTSLDEWLYDNGAGSVTGIGWGSWPGPWKLYESVSSETPRESRLWVNGVDKGWTGGSAGHDTRWNLSGYSQTEETCDFEVAELVGYDRALTPAERVQVEEYFQAKWFEPLELADTATLGITGISGEFSTFSPPLTWVGSIATSGATGMTGVFIGGPITWVSSSISTVGAAGISAAFVPGAITWAGSIATSGAAGITGTFIPGTASWAGSIATSGVSGVSGPFVPGAITWVSASIATSGAAGISGTFTPGATTWAGSIATLGMAGSSGSWSAVGAPAIWTSSFAQLGVFGLTSVFVPGARTWVSSTAASGVSGISGAFLSVITWVGSNASLGGAGQSGAFVPGARIWAGSTATVGAAGITGPLVPGPRTWVGSVATVGITALTRPFVPGAVVWVGSIATIGVAGESRDMVSGITAWWNGQEVVDMMWGSTQVLDWVKT